MVDAAGGGGAPRVSTPKRHVKVADHMGGVFWGLKLYHQTATPCLLTVASLAAGKHAPVCLSSASQASLVCFSSSFLFVFFFLFPIRENTSAPKFGSSWKAFLGERPNNLAAFRTVVCKALCVCVSTVINIARQRGLAAGLSRVSIRAPPCHILPLC